MIPEEHVEEIISTGISFMESITKAYGSDEGMKLYDHIMSVVDPDIKGKIFFSLITGEYINSIKIKSHNHTIQNKIERIKAIRSVGNYSLQDAKNITEKVESGIPLSITFDKEKCGRLNAIRTLENAGFVI